MAFVPLRHGQFGLAQGCLPLLGALQFGLAWISNLCSQFWGSLGKVCPISQGGTSLGENWNLFSLQIYWTAFHRAGLWEEVQWPTCSGQGSPVLPTLGVVGTVRVGFCHSPGARVNSAAQHLRRAPSAFRWLMWRTGQLIPPAEDLEGKGAS